MCGGNAVGTLKRSDFGMKFGLPNVGDDLKLFTMTWLAGFLFASIFIA